VLQDMWKLNSSHGIERQASVITHKKTLHILKIVQRFH